MRTTNIICTELTLGMNRVAPNIHINPPTNKSQNRSSVITVSLPVSTRAPSYLSNPRDSQYYLVCDIFGVECEFMICFFFFLWVHMFNYVFSFNAYHLFCNSARSMGKKYQSYGDQYPVSVSACCCFSCGCSLILWKCVIGRSGAINNNVDLLALH